MRIIGHRDGSGDDEGLGMLIGTSESSSGSGSAPPFLPLRGRGRRARGGQGWCDNAEPGPGADLVLVEADPLFGQLEDLLNSPARANRPDDRGHGRVGGRIDQIVGKLVGIGDAAANEQRVDPAVHHRRAERDVGPVVQAFPLGAIATTEALPVLGLQADRHVCDHDLVRRSHRRPGGGLLGALDCQRIRLAPRFESPGAASHRCHTPSRRRPSGLARPRRAPAQACPAPATAWCGTRPFRDAGCCPPLLVIGPLAWQVQRRSIGPPPRAGIAQEHPNLAVKEPGQPFRCTAAPHHTTWRPSSESRSRRRPAPRPGRQLLDHLGEQVVDPWPGGEVAGARFDGRSSGGGYAVRA